MWGAGVGRARKFQGSAGRSRETLFIWHSYVKLQWLELTYCAGSGARNVHREAEHGG